VLFLSFDRVTHLTELLQLTTDPQDALVARLREVSDALIKIKIKRFTLARERLSNLG
jgi:hypothetical protein